MRHRQIISPRGLPFALVALVCALCASVFAQTTNQVERKVTDPLTDTPNVNPLANEPPAAPRRKTPQTAPVSTEELDVRADRQSSTGKAGARIEVSEGNVDIRTGIYRLQADKVTLYEDKTLIVAEGSVVFDQGQQRITGSRAEWNYKTKLGFFVDSTGYTNQTQDGTILYFTADRVEKVAYNKILILNGVITACEDAVPKWSFKAKRAVITTGDRVRLTKPTLDVKGIPVFYLPYASISIEERDRQSGFLSPTFGGSGAKGFRLSNAYYQTLGRSADVTFRNDIYTARGLGFGAAFRTRANSRSYLNFGFYTVRDRIFGPKADAVHPNQGGSNVYVEGVQYFRNGFVAAADVSITSNLAYRQVFSDTIQQVIAPQERSQVFVNRDFGDYSFNVLARNEVTTVPNARIRIRNLPSFSFDKRPSPIKELFDKLPIYFSFESSLEGVSRKETVDDINAFRTNSGLSANAVPIITPSIVQRLDFHPSFAIPLTLGGWSLTASGGARTTFYSNSLDPLTRIVLGRDITRTYGEFEFDVRPPALAKNYYDDAGDFRFRHVIEPYATYRKIGGIDEYQRTILFDYVDAVADTSEIEYGVTNRFFTRRSTENVSGKPPDAKRKPKVAFATNAAPSKKKDEEKKDESAEAKPAEKKPSEVSSEAKPPSDIKTQVDAKPQSEAQNAPSTQIVSTNQTNAQNGASNSSQANPLRSQPYEILSVTVRGKYFFDPTFGGALIPGERNQFYPINTFSGFTYGGAPRRFSPININSRLRLRSDVFYDTRLDIDTQTGALRDIATSFGISRRLFQVFNTFYYTRALNLAPSLQQYADARGKEAGTLQGSQLSPSVFIGNRSKGLFAGAAFFFDFQNRLNKPSPLVSSTITVGYAFDCCAVVIQDYSFNVGLRRENRILFSFRLNGIGTFGTEHFGQNFR